MSFSDINLKGVLSIVGNKTTEISKKIISLLAYYGANIGSLGAKLVTIAVLLLSIFIFIKFLTGINKIIKFVILIILVVLTVSIIFSFGL